jgi:hypothetical protein
MQNIANAEDKHGVKKPNPYDAERSVMERVQSIYPDYQEEKSTGFVLHNCAKFINTELFEIEPFENHFFLELLIPLLIIGVAYLWSLSLLRTVTGPLIVLAVLCFIGFVVAGFFLLAWWTRFWSSAGIIAFYVGAVATMVPRILMFTGTWHEPHRLLLRAATDALFVCGFLSVGALLAWGFYRFSLDAVKNRRRWNHPVPYLLWSLFRALELVAEFKPEAPIWLTPAIRDELLGDLESAARCLEFFQRRFASRGSAFDAEGGQYYLRRAAGLRRFKTRVCLPNSENPGYLQEEIRRLLDSIAKGAWDTLPFADPPPRTLLPWRERALKLVRSLTFALLPALIISVLDANHRLPPQLSAYIVSVAWIWAIIGILSALDPQFGEKLSAFKDLPGFLNKSKGE